MAQPDEPTIPQEEADRHTTYRLVEGTVELRRFLAQYLFGTLGVQNSTFSADPITSAYSQGMRDAGLHLLREFDQVHPILSATMLMEFINAPLPDDQ